jgi:hypothetical protein
MDELFDGHAGDEMLAILADSLLRDQKQHLDVPGEILTHVDECKECKEKIMDVVGFLSNPDAVENIPEPKHSEPLLQISPPDRNRHFYTGKIAAVFVAFAVMIGAYFIIFDGSLPFIGTETGETDKILVDTSRHPADTKQTQDDKGTLDKNKPVTIDKSKPKTFKDSRYRINPSLENMIGSQLRSHRIEVLEPPNNSVLKGRILFSWKKDLSKPHTIKIVNNRNDVLYTYKISGKAFQFNESLPNGLYYWKLEDENELLHVGKFFIKN